MTEITRVPLQPIAKGSLAKLWLGVAAAVVLAGGMAWAAMPPGLDIDTITAGTGDMPKATDIAFVKYVGKLADGTVFDQTQPNGWPVPGIMPEGTPLPIDQMVPGFRDALLQMQKGGKYEVEIPADLAYGATPPQEAPIPPNADLSFEVEVVEFMTREDAEARYQQMMAQMQGGAGGAPGAPPAGAPPAGAQQPEPVPTPE